MCHISITLNATFSLINNIKVVIMEEIRLVSLMKHDVYLMKHDVCVNYGVRVVAGDDEGFVGQTDLQLCMVYLRQDRVSFHSQLTVINHPIM